MTTHADRKRRKQAADYAVYQERKKAWLSGLQGKVHQAAHGYPDSLVAHFDECIDGTYLSGQECEALAWLLGNKLPRAKHRPRGSLSPRPKTFAVQCARHLLHIGTQVWCREHGRKRPSNKGPNKTPTEALTACAIKWVEQEFPQQRGQISVDDVKDTEEKPSTDVQDYIGEFMSDAKQEIREIALR